MEQKGKGKSQYFKYSVDELNSRIIKLVRDEC